MAEKETTSAPRARYDFTNLNTLSVVSLATSVTGFGAVAGIITGHIALAQLKQTKQAGRGLAIAGVATGYALIGLAIVGSIARICMMGRYGTDFGPGFGGMMGNHDGGQMGFGQGQDDFGQGMQGGHGMGQFDGGPNGGGQIVVPNGGGQIDVDPNGGNQFNPGQQIPVPAPTATN
jgi:hypothetical protein